MFYVLITLETGEILTIEHVKNVSWTRGRVIFIDRDDRSKTFIPGEIEKCYLEREVVKHEEIGAAV